MQEKANKPALRFKGFDEDWEQRKLGNIAEIVGGGTPNTNISAYWDGDINWYSPAEINEQIYVNSSQRKISEQGYNNSSARMLPVGTVLFTSRAGIGKTAILSHEGCTNQGFQSIVPNPNLLDSYFIFSRTRELKQYGETIGAGSTFVEVSGKQMANMNLMMPSTIQEQKAIGNYFAQLDQLITLHQRKYTKLVNIKKAMLEKMFPKNGEDVPEIRFAGFTDPWEQRKVSDMFKITRGYVLAVTLTRNNPSAEMPYPVYSSQTKDRGLLGYYKDYLYEEAITWTTDGANAGTVNYRTGKFYCTNVCGVLLSDKVKASKMVAEALNMVTKGYVSYVGNPKLMNNIMADIEIKIPIELKEQEKISKFFEAIDDLITLHQRKLEKLQHIKKACLEKMFV